MSKKTLLNFDTVQGSYITNTTNNAFFDMTAAYQPNPYECLFTLKQPITNLKKVSLKSAEIPVAFNNIRNPKLSFFDFILNGLTYHIPVNSSFEGYYTDPAAIAAALTSMIMVGAANPGGYGWTVSVYNNYYFQIQTTTAVPNNAFSIIPTPFSRNVLGFIPSDTYNAAYNGIRGSGKFNLNPDTYINMYCNLTTSMSPNVSGIPCTFKIPVDTATHGTVFYTEGKGFQQTIEVGNANSSMSSTTLSQLSVTLYDRWGNQINGQYADYSFSILFEYD
jgi:hypothetical protein